MNQLIEFANNHLMLVTAFFVILAVLLWHSIKTSARNNIPPLKATLLMNHENAVFVDVRSIAEFNKGHIISALNIPSNGFKKQIKKLEKHKDKPIVVYCGSGTSSYSAVRELTKQGFEKIYNLRGGLHAWQNANLPLTTKS